MSSKVPRDEYEQTAREDENGNSQNERLNKEKTNRKAKKQKPSLMEQTTEELLEVVAFYLRTNTLPSRTISDYTKTLLLKTKIPGENECKNPAPIKCLLSGLDIDFKEDAFNLLKTFKYDQGKTNIEIGRDLLQEYGTNRSLEKLRAVEKHFELKQDERGLILNALSPLPYPSLHQATELFLTHTHFAPLFTATYLCNATLCANSNCEVPNYLYTSYLTKSLQKVSSDFRVDGIIAQKFSDATITKILREDKCELYPFHLDHPDFVKLVFSMRLALAKNVRMLIKDQLYNEIHSKLFVLGITNDMEKSNMYALHCKVSTTFALKYDLYYMGSFQHYSISDRANIMSLLLTSFLVPNTKDSNENTVITLAGTVIEHMTSRDEIIKALCDLIVQVVMFVKKQVIHNDIKPSNIVEYGSHYYLIDYGIATRFSSCKDGKYYDKHGQEVICKSGTMLLNVKKISLYHPKVTYIPWGCRC